MALLQTLFSVLLLANAGSATTILECPEGYTLLWPKCFLVSQDEHSGARADDYCQSVNGSVAVVDSEREMDLLRETFLTRSVHLGLNLKGRREETFKNDLKLAGFSGYTDFEVGEPNNSGGEDCVVADETRGFRWKDVDCRDTLPVLCSTPAIETSVILCQEGAIKYNQKTCFYMDQQQAYTWEEARAVCQARGGDLASIHSYEEHDFIAGLIQNYTWIGLNDILTEATYKWSDGTPLDYTNWFSSNPSDSPSYNCVLMAGYQESAGWGDTKCDYTRGLACKESTV